MEHSKQLECSQGGPDQNKGPSPSGPMFSDPERQLNMIFGGSVVYESKQKQKLATWEINAVVPVTPKYLYWSEVPISLS